ncbi:DUF6035 family protein [Myroides odoratimimus]|uniref:DUF6035 family protein n=1 Tax=Myroides odoratimimus TaxID=76832 RepID=UPI0029C05888|nr:DUF6035 family protein [Myroides odoratimimus]MDX4973925.1 DUF6035 family protein [Myroides odoratimimus]
MSKQKRSIDYVYDNVEKKIIDLNSIIKSQKDGFEIRNQYNSNTIRFSCSECNQKLVCSNSKRDTVYFRHNKNSEYCILKDSEVESNKDLLNSYKLNAYNRESPRHKELKNKLGQLLIQEPGVVIGSIDIDSKFIFGNGGKRRPDVYCEYKGFKLAFEIQLSSLPLHYIKHRYNFYKSNGIYLIWIIDLKSLPVDLDNYVRDIKHVWSDQNLFSIADHENEKLVFTCNYKQAFIYNNKEVHSKWMKKDISLGDLSFNRTEYYCLYYLFNTELNSKKLELVQIKQNIEDQKEEEDRKIRKKESEDRIKNLLGKVRTYRNKGWNFYGIKKEVDGFNYLEVELLNSSVNWNMNIEGVPLILYYIREYQFGKEERGSSMNIVEFLLTTKNFNFDINVRDNLGKGVMDYIYDNDYLLKRFYKVEKFIFYRGYQPTEQDKDLLVSKMGKFWDSKYLEWMYYSNFRRLEELDKVRNILSFLLFVESAKRMQIIGKNLKNWVQYLILVLNQNKSLHQYFVYVLTKTKLGVELEKVDKKKTIANRLNSLINEENDSTYYNILFKVHPDIFKDYITSKLNLSRSF